MKLLLFWNRKSHNFWVFDDFGVLKVNCRVFWVWTVICGVLDISNKQIKTLNILKIHTVLVFCIFVLEPYKSLIQNYSLQTLLPHQQLKQKKYLVKKCQRRWNNFIALRSNQCPHERSRGLEATWKSNTSDTKNKIDLEREIAKPKKEIKKKSRLIFCVRD